MAQLSAAAVAKLVKELRALQSEPIDGVKVLVNEDNVGEVQAEYEGPAGTPFEGGLFRMKLVFGADFPASPPKGFFLTKIFHPNVSAAGEICVNVLKRDWAPDVGLRHVLTVVRCLLVEPNPDSALNDEAGKLLNEGFEEFAKKARLMTSIHARKPSVLTAAGGANAVNADGLGAAADGKEGGAPAGSGGAAAGGAPAAVAAGGVGKPRPAAAKDAKKRSLKRL
eukprot:scaffold4.g4687.t1